MEWEKNTVLLKQVEKLLTIAERALNNFTESFSLHLENCHDGTFNFGVDSLNSFETNADEVVIEIQNTLYTTSLPTISDDLMVLIKRFDSIIDEMSHLLQAIASRKIISSPELLQQYQDFIEATSVCTSETILMVRSFFTHFNSSGIEKSAESVGIAETQCDSLEDALIAALFKSDKSDSEKISESFLISGLGNIADRCEDLANHISVVNFKTAE